MALVIVGLGNPGKEYERTRHNAGRLTAIALAKAESFGDFAPHKKSKALVAQGKIGKEKAVIVLPETMMNNSGKAVTAFIKSPKAARGLLIIHDDLDLPVGAIKMVFGRGSGGHKGVESVMRAVRSRDFARIRIGISAAGKRNQAKKVSGEGKVIKHVLSKFKPAEEAAFAKALKKAAEAAHLFAADGLAAATMFANTR